jgi:hypothetical protein
MRRDIPPQIIACLLACIACSSRSVAREDDPFPQTVGPPYGLSALAGGMTQQETTAVLAKDESNRQRLEQVLRASNRTLDRALRFDRGRLGDIIFEVNDCAATNRLLRSKWGEPATSPMNELIWQSKSSHWVADVTVPQHGLSCVLLFTSSSFFGSKPNAGLARFEPGMSRASASRIDAALAKATTAISMPGIAEGYQVATFRGDQVENTYMVLPTRAIVALRAAWGTGATLDDGRRTVWTDPDTRWRATLDDKQLFFDKAMRWEDWLGDGPFVRALGSVVGKSLAELRRDRGDALIEDFDAHDKRTLYSMRIPAEEWSPRSTSSASLHVEHDIVTSAAVTLQYTTLSVRDQMLRQFEKKWGAKTATKLGLRFTVASTNIYVTDLHTEFQINMSTSAPTVP